jgi:hypothetical protein
MPVYRGKLSPDLNGSEGWMDKKIDFQWIKPSVFTTTLR